MPVFLYEDKIGVSDIRISFKNGINSNELIKTLDEYKEDYYVKKINVNKDNYFVSCEDIRKCIDKIFDEESNNFNNTYITNGFKINEINLLTNIEYVKDFFKEDINITIN